MTTDERHRFHAAGLMPPFQVGDGERARWEKAIPEIQRLCKVFQADPVKVLELAGDKIEDGMSVAQAVTWAKDQVMTKRAPQIPGARQGDSVRIRRAAQA